ncbi:hypothetical protein HYPSUDRAFT_39913 [Hypholoma sublateritium FD-334 SS-4]|uniref:CFEM domain-containing protein n=1 Tax=Hypholoma sublateritium (strain FD-334 SS-4) TaxID=945553 RepID=A0A0D2L8B6_HYPSF|nr:hypothetical protein HYPSUDRAFT_39913 [Hypholoma sublateritium FD-334 SS-4]
MHSMRFLRSGPLSLLLVSVFNPIRLTVAQGTGTGITGLPQCADTCAQTAATAIGCALTDTVCICSSRTFAPATEQCATSVCTPSDKAKVSQALNALCLDIPKTGTGSTTTTSIATSTTSSASSTTSTGLSSLTTSTETGTKLSSASSASTTQTTSSSASTPSSLTSILTPTQSTGVTTVTSATSLTSSTPGTIPLSASSTTVVVQTVTTLPLPTVSTSGSANSVHDQHIGTWAVPALIVAWTLVAPL